MLGPAYMEHLQLEQVPYRVNIHHAEAQKSVTDQSKAYVDDTSYTINAHNLDPGKPSTQE